MPKMKTKRTLAKRVKRTGSGKLTRHHQFTSHLAASKTHKQKRNLKKSTSVSSADYKRIKLMIQD